MNRKGICYDVGCVMDGNWRPIFDPEVIHRELGIIRDDLHCNAVRICGLDIDRLTTSAGDALEQGLEVWLSPLLWDKGPDETLAYITKAASAAEALHRQWPDRLVLSVGSELTLFMQGIVPGRSVTQRMRHPSFVETVKAGRHNPPLNAFLGRANEAVRRVFHGPLTYASLVWEEVDWSLFDFVGIDHYRAARIRDSYLDMLRPAFGHGKPVVITEFGSRTYQGADTTTEGMGGDLVDPTPNLRVALVYLTNMLRMRLFGTQLPPPRLPLKPGNYVRDEATQAREIVDVLALLDQTGVDGAFVSTFISPTAYYDPDPRRDLDMNGYGLVKSYAAGHGATYPDMTWEPKQAFSAVAEFYAGHPDR